jgi:hypothetical protein
LVAREEYFTDLADISTTYSLTKDNALILKRQDRSISDRVGFGEASDFETLATVNPGEQKSIERKGIGLDTDNNFADFRISDNPTPGASFMQANIEYEFDYSGEYVNTNEASYYKLLVNWQSQSQNLDFFQVQYKINSEGWKDWKANTTELTGEFTAYRSFFHPNNRC